MKRSDDRTMHFVNFRNDAQRIANAMRVFGVPDFIHFYWDARARAEILADDIAVFAEGSAHDAINPYTYDDSAHR